MNENEPITGEVVGVYDAGSIIMVTIRPENGEAERIYFDRRQFAYMYEDVGPLFGKTISYDGKAVEVLD